MGWYFEYLFSVLVKKTEIVYVIGSNILESFTQCHTSPAPPPLFHQTQEVDSGDALGHDFDPVAALLAAPAGWPSAGSWSPLWSRLFRAARAAAELVATAPPNALAAGVAGRLRSGAPLCVPSAALCLRVMAETALLKETDGTPRSSSGE